MLFFSKSFLLCCVCLLHLCLSVSPPVSGNDEPASAPIISLQEADTASSGSPPSTSDASTDDSTCIDAISRILAPDLKGFNLKCKCPKGSIGTFDFTTNLGVGFDAGTTLTTGNTTGVFVKDGSYTAGSTSGGGRDEDLEAFFKDDPHNAKKISFDSCSVEFDVEVPIDTTLRVRYAFASSEFLRCVPSNSLLDDVMGIWVNGVNIATLPEETTPLTVENLRANFNLMRVKSVQDPLSPYNVSFNAMTHPLWAESPIMAGVHHIKIAVADVGDALWDSAVFLQEMGMTTTVPAVTCVAKANPTLFDASKVDTIYHNVTLVNDGKDAIHGVYLVGYVPSELRISQYTLYVNNSVMVKSPLCRSTNYEVICPIGTLPGIDAEPGTNRVVLVLRVDYDIITWVTCSIMKAYGTGFSRSRLLGLGPKKLNRTLPISIIRAERVMADVRIGMRATTNVLVENLGKGQWEYNITLSNPPAWLHVEHIYANVSAQSTGIQRYVFDTTNGDVTSSGVYQTMAAVHSNDPETPMLEVAIIMFVWDPPAVHFSPLNITARHVRFNSSDLPLYNVTLNNMSPDYQNWTVANLASLPPYITLTPTSGYLDRGASTNLLVDIAGDDLLPGKYKHNIHMLMESGQIASLPVRIRVYENENFAVMDTEPEEDDLPQRRKAFFADDDPLLTGKSKDGEVDDADDDKDDVEEEEGIH